MVWMSKCPILMIIGMNCKRNLGLGLRNLKPLGLINYILNHFTVSAIQKAKVSFFMILILVKKY